MDLGGLAADQPEVESRDGSKEEAVGDETASVLQEGPQL